MAIQSIRDVYDAYENGRVHIQPFYKVAGQAGDYFWQDWAYAAGKPAVDARIGTALECTPVIATRNKALYFPDVLPGQTRHLAELQVVTTAGGASQASVALLLYDLVAVYPLIDGDSTDEQVMENTAVLPRYSDGFGVIPVLVNHVAPQVSTGLGTYTYTSHSGDVITQQFGITSAGITKANGTASTSTVSTGSLGLPRGSGCCGVRNIVSMQFSTPPGGLWAIYLVKVLASINNNDGRGLAGAKCATEKQMLQMNACHMPVVLDGAHLGFFYMPAGGARSVAIAGNATFIWG